MARVRSKPRNGKYQGFYSDRHKKTRFFTGTRKKAETKRIAEALEVRETQIRLGYLKAPDAPTRKASKAFQEVLQEFLDRGNAHGGRGGRPWGKTHAKERRSKTTWWLERLNLSTMEDFDGILPKAEAALRELQNGGCRNDGRILSGKTINNYIENLRSFCNWAVKRGYLKANPVADLGHFDDSPTSMRRALTQDEINRLWRLHHFTERYCMKLLCCPAFEPVNSDP